MADLTWNKGGKRLLAGIDRLIELLHGFDENPLPDKALESVTQLLGSHAFSPEYQAKDHSISCVPILSLWVVAVVKLVFCHVILLSWTETSLLFFFLSVIVLLPKKILLVLLYFLIWC